MYLMLLYTDVNLTISIDSVNFLLTLTLSIFWASDARSDGVTFYPSGASSVNFTNFIIF